MACGAIDQLQVPSHEVEVSIAFLGCLEARYTGDEPAWVGEAARDKRLIHILWSIFIDTYSAIVLRTVNAWARLHVVGKKEVERVFGWFEVIGCMWTCRVVGQVGGGGCGGKAKCQNGGK
ncbi:hypothetical protein A3843_02145 [Pseudovibrio exalbescens]|uniref:Uncharacterized protein n=1 Tax=Pseudovibrio exalbescens TaxID=197461 RepID=A0A1U7JM24_9HYPH|nr:hypothetical protein A3843_02145 [Pseudovibrio exalbescens]